MDATVSPSGSATAMSPVTVPERQAEVWQQLDQLAAEHAQLGDLIDRLGARLDKVLIKSSPMETPADIDNCSSGLGASVAQAVGQARAHVASLGYIIGSIEL